MKSKRTGAYLGIPFAIAGLVSAGLIMGVNFSRISHIEPEAIVLVFAFFACSLFFGSRAGAQIERKKFAAPAAGILSSFLTTISTITITTLYLFISGEFQHVSDFFAALLFYNVVSLLFGGIPMLIIGALYGLALKYLIEN